MTLMFPRKSKGRILAPNELLCSTDTASTWLGLGHSLWTHKSPSHQASSGSCCDGWTQEPQLQWCLQQQSRGSPRHPAAKAKGGERLSAAYLLLVCALPEEHPSLDPGKPLPKETQTSKRAGERNPILG